MILRSECLVFWIPHSEVPLFPVSRLGLLIRRTLVRPIGKVMAALGLAGCMLTSAGGVSAAEVGFRCPILYYHEVPSQGGLEAQLAALIRAGYIPTTLSRVLDTLDGLAPPPPGCLVLTFDDALRSQHRNALPVLTRWAVSGTFFLMPSFRDGVHAYMNTDEIRDLVTGGQEIGSHTLNHANLPALRRVNFGAFLAELVLSRGQIEALTGHSVDLFAYPNGSVDLPTATEVERAGYRGAASTIQGNWQTSGLRYFLRRVPANPWEAPSTILARLVKA